MNLKDVLRTVQDFPKPGIGFIDITPLLANPEAFRECLKQLDELCPPESYDAILGIESRGFLFGAALAHAHGKPFAPARKPGKLPWKTYQRSYQLEYGEDSLQVHQDAFAPGQRVLVVDDLLATGGTLRAAIELVRDTGATPVGAFCLVELDFLGARERLSDLDISLHTLVHVDGE